MPALRRRKKLNPSPVGAASSTRITKRNKQSSPTVIAEPRMPVELNQVPPAPLDMHIDSEDEYMDLEAEDDALQILSQPPSNSHIPSVPLQRTTPKVPKILSTQDQGLASSIFAVATHPPSSGQATRNTRQAPAPAAAVQRSVANPSSATTNELATTLLAWQNAGAIHLRSLPPAIAADLKAIVTRSAARVIAGLSVFDQTTTGKNPQTTNRSAGPATHQNRPDTSQKQTYATAASRNLILAAQTTLTKKTVTAPPPKQAKSLPKCDGL